MRAYFKTDEVICIDYSEEWDSLVFYHKCGAITLVPRDVLERSL